MKPPRSLLLTLVLVVIAFDILQILGVSGPVLMNNLACYRLLGCNAGFFGYDIFVHFLSGAAEALFAVWLMARYPAWNLLGKKCLKNLLVLVALAALCGVVWEIGEFAHDQFFIHVLRIDLRAPINMLAQPSNADTMGDLTFGLIGALTAALIAQKAWIKKLFR